VHVIDRCKQVIGVSTWTRQGTWKCGWTQCLPCRGWWIQHRA